MYANKFAVAVKHRGKVLQEFGELVYLPFGSEYGILLKNLNTVQASVKVSIDDQDATEGINLVVPPNGSIDIERFIKNGNLAAGNRFKFIGRNAAVTAHRGSRIDDGIIKVTYAFEVPAPRVVYAQPYRGWTASGSLSNGSNQIYAASSNSLLGSITKSAAAGITAPGSVSHQQFQVMSAFQTEPVASVIILQLAGKSAEVGNIQNTVYTRSKVYCTVCGFSSRPSAAFCSQCGSSLNIIG